MSCGFDKGLLAAHYDGETTADERAEVERHLAGCPECARDLASMKDLSAALKPLARASAPMSIAEGVLKEIRPAATSPRRWVSWGASAAAAVLLAVGTVLILNRETGPLSTEPVAVGIPRSAPEDSSRHGESKEAGRRAWAKEPASAPQAEKALGGADLKEGERKRSPTADPPRAETPAESDAQAATEFASKLEKADKDGKFEDRDATSAKALQIKTPPASVLRVASADVAAARAAVEAFLAERKMKWAPGAALLGKSEFVANHYLQLDLTDEESASLQKRLGELKQTAIATGDFDAEKKRVAEELAKADSFKKAKDRAAADDAVKEPLKEDAPEAPARGRANVSPEPPRKKFIFVFEPWPKK